VTQRSSNLLAWAAALLFAFGLVTPTLWGTSALTIGSLVLCAIPFLVIFTLGVRGRYSISQPWTSLVVVIGTIVFAVDVSKMAWAGNAVTRSSLENMVLFALPLAGIYAISASGLVVVYTTTGIFNFAQGAIGMFMAYVYWQMVDKSQGGWGWPSWLAVPLVLLLVAPLFGVLLNVAIMRHLQGQELVVQLMVTVGLLFALIGLTNMIWNQNLGHSLNPFFQDHSVKLGDVFISWHRLITLGSAVALAIGLRILLFRTRTGIAMRAVVDNRGLAGLAGARASLIGNFSWALGCSLAALAGILLAPEADMASGGTLTLLIITAFAAAVVGRLRSLPMTYLGAFILALAISWSQQFLVFAERWTQVPAALPVIMLFIVLLLLPRADLQFARSAVMRRPERVSTVRDTFLGMLLLFAAILIVSGFLSGTNLSRASVGMCTALVALSLVPLTGWAGQVSLAPLAFAGIGAAIYARHGGAHGSLWAVLLAGLVCVPIGALLAFPAMRLQGLYLALATMAFASLVEFLFFTQSFALGDQDRTVERLDLFGYQFTGERSFLLLLTAVFGLCAMAVVALRRSAFGRRLVALRDSEAASVTVGINVLETKLAVFALSAGIAGFAGAFFAMEYGTLSQSKNFEMLAGLPIVLALVVGGVSFAAGALFAGVFGLFAVLLQDNWHISLWTAAIYLAPGLAAFGIIANPHGAVVAIGEGFARLLPWRHDARRDYEEQKVANADPEVGGLGLEEPFTEADVLLMDRELGISNEVPRVATVGN